MVIPGWGACAQRESLKKFKRDCLLEKNKNSKQRAEMVR